METNLSNSIVKCVENNVLFTGRVGTNYTVQELFSSVSLRSLNDLYKNIKKELDSLDTDSLYENSNTAKKNLLQLQVDTIKGVFDYKKDLADKAKRKEELAEKKAKLLNLLERKEDEKFEGMSAEDIQKEIAALEV